MSFADELNQNKALIGLLESIRILNERLRDPLELDRALTQIQEAMEKEYSSPDLHDNVTAFPADKVNPS